MALSEYWLIEPLPELNPESWAYEEGMLATRWTAFKIITDDKVEGKMNQVSEENSTYSKLYWNYRVKEFKPNLRGWL